MLIQGVWWKRNGILTYHALFWSIIHISKQQIVWISNGINTITYIIFNEYEHEYYFIYCHQQLQHQQLLYQLLVQQHSHEHQEKTTCNRSKRRCTVVLCQESDQSAVQLARRGETPRAVRFCWQGFMVGANVARRGDAPSSEGEKKKERKGKETLVKRKVTVARAGGCSKKWKKKEKKVKVREASNQEATEGGVAGLGRQEDVEKAVEANTAGKRERNKDKDKVVVC